ncbi:MAG: hypothetical protein ACPL1Y_05645 [Thermoplasmata archaeon]
MKTQQQALHKIYLSNYRIVDACGSILVDTPEILEFFDKLSANIADIDTIYIVDMDGFDEGTPQLDLLSEISDMLSIWVEANSKNVDDVSDILVAGADIAVLNLKNLALDEIQKICEETQSVAFLIDDVNPEREKLDYLTKLAREEKCEVILRCAGEIPSFLENYLKEIPVYLDGGGMADVDLRWKKINIAGTIKELDLDGV